MLCIVYKVVVTKMLVPVIVIMVALRIFSVWLNIESSSSVWNFRLGRHLCLHRERLKFGTYTHRRPAAELWKNLRCQRHRIYSGRPWCAYNSQLGFKVDR